MLGRWGGWRCWRRYVLWVLQSVTIEKVRDGLVMSAGLRVGAGAVEMRSWR